MVQVGDTIQVTVSGATLSGGGASIGIGQGALMKVAGTIERDLGDRWLVRLGIAVGGKNLLEVPK